MEYKLFLLVFIACLNSCYATYYINRYMDDSSSSLCWGNTIYLSSLSQGVNVSAWDRYSISRTPYSSGCEITISSYSTYRLKYKFSSGSYILSSDVSFKVYGGASTSSPVLRSFSRGDSFPTYYSSTDDMYLTIKLRNPSRSTRFDLAIQIESYRYVVDDLYHFTYRYYWNAGSIAGIVIGIIVFIVVVSVVSVYVRRRRVLASTTVIRSQVPATQMTTQVNYPVAQPPPYAAVQAQYPPGKSPYPTSGAINRPPILQAAP